MKKRMLAVILVMLLLLIAMPGCSAIRNSRYNEEIKTLLPSKEGFVWYYSGFAEYDHKISLDFVEKKGGSTVYTISGEVGDVSGGESQKDYSLNITYTVENGIWVQEKSEETMMDSDFDKLEILRGPIKEGASWTQEQIDKAGKTRTLECTIEEVNEEEGLKVLAVSYREPDTEYYEIRQIKESIGIIDFKKLWINPYENFEIGYWLWKTE